VENVVYGNPVGNHRGKSAVRVRYGNQVDDAVGKLMQGIWYVGTR